jgi:3-hydroxyacyl-CoA dehydrogenase
MTYKLNHAIVLGSGTMGSGIAALLANAGVRVTLLDIVPTELTPKEAKAGLTLEHAVVRNRIAASGLQSAIKSKPASFHANSVAQSVTTGNMEDDLECVAEADWVIEAIIENLAIKRELMERLDSLRGPNTIVSTNTSGIPIAEIAEGRTEGFRQHFLGTHFFNPPRYLKLLELIPGEDTSKAVLTFIQQIGEVRLGKGVVICKDRPNFIANRLGAVAGVQTVNAILEQGLTVKEADAITGEAIGRPKSGTFRLLDLVGIDVWGLVAGNLKEAIPDDPIAQNVLDNPSSKKLIDHLISSGSLGNKSGQGFYKTVRTKGGKEFWELNLDTLEYEPPSKARFESVGKARKLENLADRINVMIAAEDRAGELVRTMTFHSLAYASLMVPEVSDSIYDVDNAMRWGFNSEAGPFQIWDMIGVAHAVELMKSAGLAPAAWIEKFLSAGHSQFYRVHNGREQVYSPVTAEYTDLDPIPRRLVLADLKAEGKKVAGNASASIVDLGEGIAGLEFHTKMNALDQDLGEMAREILERTDSDFDGIVVGNDAVNFSAGANLFMVVMNAQAGQWDVIETLVKGLQDINMAIRYFHKPIVAAPAGLALGGGAEMIMHASRIVAASELYTGLVEMGAGVIPAGGGVKEMVRRVVNPVMHTQNAAALAFHQRLFQQIGQGEVATSAEEARDLGILSPSDRIVMNRDRLLYEARQEAAHMAAAGYIPPRSEPIYAGGRDTYNALKVGVYLWKESGQISEYEQLLGKKLAHVLSGGQLTSPAWVSEQYMLDLEREAFVSLCGQAKTQERMWNLLNTGKVLRN